MRPIVLSGPACAGKSTLAERLVTAGYTVVTAVAAIERVAGKTGLERGELQAIGALLERENAGSWLVNACLNADFPIVLDAARTIDQVEVSRASIPGVIVVHLTADSGVRGRRYEDRRRRRESDRAAGFAALASTELELLSERLGRDADVVLRTDRFDRDQIAEAVETLARA
jgi:adenylate kinase family enzyme